MNNVKLIFFLFVFIISSNLSFSQVNSNKIKTIVIDPGHGGKDSGTMGTKRFKIYEKHIALAVSLKLGKYISEAFPEIDVIYTRSSDVFLELNERTEIANNANADLFISIHCDGFTNPKPSGASVFVMGMSKLKANMDVAMRENAAIFAYIIRYCTGFLHQKNSRYSRGSDIRYKRIICSIENKTGHRAPCCLPCSC